MKQQLATLFVLIYVPCVLALSLDKYDLSDLWVITAQSEDVSSHYYHFQTSRNLDAFGVGHSQPSVLLVHANTPEQSNSLVLCFKGSQSFSVRSETDAALQCQPLENESAETGSDIRWGCHYQANRDTGILAVQQGEFDAQCTLGNSTLADQGTTAFAMMTYRPPVQLVPVVNGTATALQASDGESTSYRTLGMGFSGSDGPGDEPKRRPPGFMMQGSGGMSIVLPGLPHESVYESKSAADSLQWAVDDTPGPVTVDIVVEHNGTERTYSLPLDDWHILQNVGLAEYPATLQTLVPRLVSNNERRSTYLEQMNWLLKQQNSQNIAEFRSQYRNLFNNLLQSLADLPTSRDLINAEVAGLYETHLYEQSGWINDRASDERVSDTYVEQLQTAIQQLRLRNQQEHTVRQRLLFTGGQLIIEPVGLVAISKLATYFRDQRDALITAFGRARSGEHTAAGQQKGTAKTTDSTTGSQQNTHTLNGANDLFALLPDRSDDGNGGRENKQPHTRDLQCPRCNGGPCDEREVKVYEIRPLVVDEQNKRVTPENLVGKKTWSRLRSGEIITGVKETDFILEKVSRFNKLIRNVKNTGLMGHQHPYAVVITHLKGLAKKLNHQSDNVLILRMEMAGILKIDSLSNDSEFQTTPTGFLNRKKIQDYCDFNKPLGVYINNNKIPGRQSMLCRALFEELLEEDIKTLDKYLYLRDQDNVNYQGLSTADLAELPEEGSIEYALRLLVTGTDISKVLARLKKTVFPSFDNRFKRHVDTLLLREYMIQYGLISFDERKQYWDRFKIEMHDLANSGHKAAADIYLHSTNGEVLTKQIKAFWESIESKKNTLPVSQAPAGSFYRSPEQLIQAAMNVYKPGLEKAQWSPGLKNEGNLCYCSSVLKIVSSQLPIETIRTVDVQTTESGLQSSLSLLLQSIKLGREHLVENRVVNSLNKRFVSQLRSDSRPAVKALFSGNTQNDAQEFALIVYDTLGLNKNPKYSFVYSTQLQASLDTQTFSSHSWVDNDKEAILALGIDPDKYASYELCLDSNLKEEVIKYSWEEEAVIDLGLNVENRLEQNRKFIKPIRAELAVHKKNTVNDKCVLANQSYDEAILSMTLKDNGYFERVVNGVVKRSVLPPWTRTTQKKVIKVDTDVFESLVVLPKIFSYEHGQSRKLEKEGMAFFRSVLSGMRIPAHNQKNEPIILEMNVAGFCSHRGTMEYGHYVYLEKAVNGQWVLNDDDTTRVLGDEEDMKDYLFSNSMTPYIYLLKKQGSHH